MKILITGRTGQVGHELESNLQSHGQVIALDRRGLDLTNFDQIVQIIRETKPDWIINPAAYTAVDKAESEPDLAMRVNGLAPGIIAEEAKKINAALIHYSTDYVFSGSNPLPYQEKDEPFPLNVYGKTKLAGEQAIQAVGGEYLILRTSWVYGLHGKNFLTTILRLLQEKNELQIVNDQHGAPTWSRTVAAATESIVARKVRDQKRVSLLDLPSQVLHLSARGQTSWYDFAVEIVRLASQKKIEILPIPSSSYPVPAARPKNSQLCCDLFESAFVPLPDWKTALMQCLNR